MTIEQLAAKCKALADSCAAVPMDRRDTPEYRNLFGDYAAACFELRRRKQVFN